jgi:hypothetical protein
VVALLLLAAPAHAKALRSTPLLDAISTRQAKKALALLAGGADPTATE